MTTPKFKWHVRAGKLHLDGHDIWIEASGPTRAGSFTPFIEGEEITGFRYLADAKEECQRIAAELAEVRGASASDGDE
jgi:hypothetical protein